MEKEMIEMICNIWGQAMTFEIAIRDSPSKRIVKAEKRRLMQGYWKYKVDVSIL